MKGFVQLTTLEPANHPSNFEVKVSRPRCGNYHRSSCLKVSNRSSRLHGLVLMRAMIHTQASNLVEPPVPWCSRIGRVIAKCDFYAGLSHSVDPICPKAMTTGLVSSGPYYVQYPRRETKRNETSMQDPAVMQIGTRHGLLAWPCAPCAHHSLILTAMYPKKSSLDDWTCPCFSWPC